MPLRHVRSKSASDTSKSTIKRNRARSVVVLDFFFVFGAFPFGFAGDVAYLIPKKYGRGDRSCHVADREGGPYAVESHERGKSQQKRYHEDYLACQREEDRLSRHAQSLEEVGGHNLETDNPERDHGDAQTVDGASDLLGVLHEHRCNRVWIEDTEECPDSRYGYRCGSCEPESPEQSLVSSRAIVVAYDRLHALANADDDEDEYGDIAVEHHNGSDCVVASVIDQRVVDDGVDTRTCHIDQERCHADVEHPSYYRPFEPEGPACEMQCVVAVEEVAHHPGGGDEHRYVCGDGCAAYAPVETEKEDRGEYGVEHGSDHVGVHRLGRIARGPHHVVVGES